MQSRWDLDLYISNLDLLNVPKYDPAISPVKLEDTLAFA